ncbi:MAG: tetratricopeptide repeat protein [Candidatus Krumholzibacteriia bacterium]
MKFHVIMCVIALTFVSGLAGAQPESTPRVQAEALFVDAQKALSRGDYTEAERLLKKALTSDPAFTSAIWQLAQIYESRGELDYARELLIRGLKQDPGASWAREKLVQIESSLARTIFAEARGYLNSGEYDLAIPKLSAYLGLKPDDPAALVAMAKCHLEKGNLKTARQYIEKVRMVDPGNAEISSLTARMEKPAQDTRLEKLLAEAQIALLDTTSTATVRARTALQTLIEADPANSWAKERLADLNRSEDENAARLEKRKSKPAPAVVAEGLKAIDRSKGALATAGHFLFAHLSLIVLGAVLCVLVIDVRRRMTRRSYPLEGMITVIPILDIVSLVNGNLRTGRLIVVSSDAKGELYFEKGEIIHARCDGLTGKIAFHKLMDIRSGRFFFHNHLPNVRRTITDPLSLLLLSMKPHEDSVMDLEESGAREEVLSTHR